MAICRFIEDLLYDFVFMNKTDFKPEKKIIWASDRRSEDNFIFLKDFFIQKVLRHCNHMKNNGFTAPQTVENGVKCYKNGKRSLGSGLHNTFLLRLRK